MIKSKIFSVIHKQGHYKMLEILEDYLNEFFYNNPEIEYIDCKILTESSVLLFYKTEEEKK